MDFMDNFIERCSHDVARKEDDLIRSVLPSDISIPEISKRCKWVSYIETPHIRTLCLDGKAVLTLHDPEPEHTIRDDGSMYLNITQKYFKH